MKTYKQFIEESVAASLVKLVARTAMQRNMLRAGARKAMEKAAQAGQTATPRIPIKPRQIKIERPITGFRTARGTQYTWNPETRTTKSVTASGHHVSPAGEKPESSYTIFSPRRYAQPMLDQWKTKKDWATGKPLTGDWKHVQGHENLYSNKPELGTHPIERWRNYPAGVEYAQGAVSRGGENLIHMGSEIDKIYYQSKPGQVRLNLSPEDKLDLSTRVRTALRTPRNIKILKQEIKNRRMGRIPSQNPTNVSPSVPPRIFNEPPRVPDAYRVEKLR